MIKFYIFKIICDNLGEEYSEIEKEYLQTGVIEVETQDYIQIYLRIEDEFDIVLDFLHEEKENKYIDIDNLVNNIVLALKSKTAM